MAGINWRWLKGVLGQSIAGIEVLINPNSLLVLRLWTCATDEIYQ